MSRLCGIMGLRGQNPSPADLDRMIQANCLRQTWEKHSDKMDVAMLGWCGWQKPRVHKRGNILVAMDGLFFDNFFAPDHEDLPYFLKQYDRYGFEEAVKRVNGDFSIALYDGSTQTLWIARDRLGVKPLYYFQGKESFAFSSQPRGLLSLPEVSWEPNLQFVAIFAGFHYRYFDNQWDQSAYKDIRQLPPGHLISVQNSKVTVKQYWTVEEFHPHDYTEQELVARYRELILQSVEKRLKRATNPAFTLSGGLDSSTVLSSAVQITGNKQVAYSTVYEDSTYNESEEIKDMEVKLSQWNGVKVEAPNIADIDRMVAVHDEPVATATWLSHYVLCQNAHDNGVQSLFGGLGGDELNAGEYEYFFFFFADLWVQGHQERLHREVDKWVLYHDHPIFKKSFATMEDALARMVDVTYPGRCLPDRKRMTRYFGTLDYDFRKHIKAFEPVMEHPSVNYLKNRARQDLFRETTPCCLRALDRNNTAFELESFQPFLDYEVVEFMFRVSPLLQIKDGVTKSLLRQATKGLLPDKTRTRIAKVGWNAPTHVWFAKELRPALLDIVDSRAFRERGIYNVKQVRRLIDEHQEIVTSGFKRETHMMFLWQLVNLEMWLRHLDTQQTQG